jgi:hypothetical protein
LSIWDELEVATEALRTRKYVTNQALGNVKRLHFYAFFWLLITDPNASSSEIPQRKKDKTKSVGWQVAPQNVSHIFVDLDDYPP